MFQWYREWREIRNAPRPCETCDVLKVELANARLENQRLLNHILNPQYSEPESIPDKAPSKPLFLPRKPWKVKQQELEQKDRIEHDRIIREFQAKTGINPAAVNSVSIPADRSQNVAELEKQLGVSDAG